MRSESMPDRFTSQPRKQQPGRVTTAALNCANLGGTKFSCERVHLGRWKQTNSRRLSRRLNQCHIDQICSKVRFCHNPAGNPTGLQQQCACKSHNMYDGPPERHNPTCVIVKQQQGRQYSLDQQIKGNHDR